MEEKREIEMNVMVYSADGGDYWTEDYDEMRGLCLDFAEANQITITFSQGVKNPQKHSDFIDGDHIVTFMQERAYDEFDEYADGYLEELTDEDKEQLGKLVVDFLNERAPQPRFYHVDGVEEIISPLDEDELQELLG